MPREAASRRAPTAGAAALAAALLAWGEPAPAAGQPDDPRAWLRWEKDFDAPCTAHQGVMVMVRNAHPGRALKLRLERWHMNAPTGDRSRSLLAPGAEPERLGCSRTQYGAQEWRVFSIEFADQPPTD